MKTRILYLSLLTISVLGCEVNTQDENGTNALSEKNVEVEDLDTSVKPDNDDKPFNGANKQSSKSEQEKALDLHSRLLNYPEIIAAEAERRQRERYLRRQKLLASLAGNGLSYELGKGHLTMQGQDFESIALQRCLTPEDIIKSNPGLILIKSNPGLILGKDRVEAPSPGLVLNLPDHACSHDMRLNTP